MLLVINHKYLQLTANGNMASLENAALRVVQGERRDTPL
jgi:hypothetical protein